MMQFRKIGFYALATVVGGLATGRIVFAEADTAARTEIKTETKKETSDWTTFKESDGRVSFSYPKGWVEYQSTKPGTKPGDFIITLHAPQNRDNCNLTASPPISNLTVHQYQEQLDKFAASPAGSKMTKVSDRFVNVDGDEMYERIWKTKSPDGQDVAQFSFGVIKDRLYQIVLTCHYDKLKENTALFERIGESLRVKNQK